VAPKTPVRAVRGDGLPHEPGVAAEPPGEFEGGDVEAQVPPDPASPG
jgi:hypothetical protein